MNDALATVDRNASVMDSWTVMREKALVLVKSGFLPKAIKTPEQAITIMQTGQELGLGVMQSLRGIHVVDGNPTLAATLMAALVYQRLPGAVLRIVETTSERCVVDAARPGQQPTRFTWDLAKAKTAGLLGKNNWRSHPDDMLRSRCISQACRAVFPDCILGLHTPEELEPIAAVPGVASLPLQSAAPATYIDAVPEPEAPKLEAPAEPYRFKSGSKEGKAITDDEAVPTHYLLELKKRGVAPSLRRTIDAELARRDSPDYIAAKLQQSIDQRAAAKNEGFELETVTEDGEVVRVDPLGLNGDSTARENSYPMGYNRPTDNLPEPGSGDAP